MRFLDMMISPFGTGSFSSVTVFCVGVGLFAAVCGFTVAVLVQYFRKGNTRREKRRDKILGDAEETL